MTTLATVDNVTRATDIGFDTIRYSDCNQLQEKDLLIIEPPFRDFGTATNDQLGLPFKIGGELPVKPGTLLLCLSYSQRNASIFKGWVLDVVDYYKSLGYPFFTSTHVPYEAYGCPMVGSVLVLVFSSRKFAFVPKRSQVLPNDMFPSLMFHAPAARVKGSIYAGTASVNGFFNSRLQFLPDFSGWDSGSLRCEYRAGNSLETHAMRPEDINKLFGVTQHANQTDLHLVTPPTVLHSIAEGLKYPAPVPQPTVA